MKKGDESSGFYSRNKRMIKLSIIILVLAAGALFGTKLYLIFNLLVGDDSLVILDVDSQDLFLKNSESVEVNFDVYASANPFCKSVCDYEFVDLSSGEGLDVGEFSTIISNPTSVSYDLVAPDFGFGQKLYSFEVSCRSVASSFCEAKNDSIDKSVVVALNYELSDEQSELRNQSLGRIDFLKNEFLEMENLSADNDYLLSVLSEKVLVENISSFDLDFYRVKILELISSFENHDYLNVVGDEFVFNYSNLILENERLKDFVYDYNGFVLGLDEVGDKLRVVVSSEMSENDSLVVADLVAGYNDLVLDVGRINVSEKKFDLGVLNFSVDAIEVGNGSVFVFDEILNNSFSLIDLNYSYDFNRSVFEIDEVSSCCYFGSCAECSSIEGYPIVLLHGHSFNSGVSARKSLMDMRGIQKALSHDGFLDGGDLILGVENSYATFDKVNARVVFSASYYFDVYQDVEDMVTLETKSDDLDSYAIRLNEIVEDARMETGKDKVVLVAHSMGGLVARKYIQLFGEDDVAELIMIGTPNHGISGLALSTCSLLGAQEHCDDMKFDSLFLNKLNYGSRPSIPVYNIVGLGCDTNGENGDGVVGNSSAYLDWADDYYVEGNCSGFDYFHVEMIKEDEGGEVYDLIERFVGE